MRRVFYQCLFGILLSFNSFAQREDNIWAFGKHSGLDFNALSPILISTQNVSMEGAASISNGAGHLLFYSDGNKIWDANHNVMPNGNGLLGNGPPPSNFHTNIGSATQGVAIVPIPGNTNRYYLFTLESVENMLGNASPGYLRYSIVDMSLNNNMGDILSGQKNIILDSFMTEKMQVAAGKSCDYWLLVHRYNSTEYRAYHIDNNGINTIPVISNGVSTLGLAGEMKISPDFSKVASVDVLDSISRVDIATFDNASGIISNAQQILFPVQLTNQVYGIDFSPDNKKLYCGEERSLGQFDLTLWPNAAAIQASHTIVYSNPATPTPTLLFGMRRGPDQKIYVSWRTYGDSTAPAYIGCINNPNISGAACNFNPMAIQVIDTMFFTNFGNLPGYGLGNHIVINRASDTIFLPTKDTAICGNISTMAFSGYDYCYWSTGLIADTCIVSQAGTYVAYGFQNCNAYIDTFKVRFSNFNISLGEDTTICAGDSLNLNATVSGGNYLWQDGSRGPELTVRTSGQYYVAVNDGGCYRSDTVTISVITPSLTLSLPDTLICSGTILRVKAETVPEESILLWNTGITTATININEGGTYIVTAISICSTLTDSIQINEQNCNCPLFAPNAFSPNDDGLNDVFNVHIGCELSTFELAIFNRYGQRVFHSPNINKGWDGNFNGKICDIGTYFYKLNYKGPDGHTFDSKGDITLIR